MTTTGDVELTIADGAAGSVIVPAQQVQVVIGPATLGSYATVVATRSPQTLRTTFGYGIAVEAAALICLAGGTVLFMRSFVTTTGTATAVTASAAGTSVVTVTLDGTYGAYDDYLFRLVYVTGGTIGVTGISFQISLDAARTFGPTIALGTASTYLVVGTGITLNFAAGTAVAAGTQTFSTTAMLSADSNALPNPGIKESIVALDASPYGTTGWGSMHIVGKRSQASATAIQGYLDTQAAGYIFGRVIVDGRDALIPTAWGGAGETEATWTTSVSADYAAASAKRICASIGHYNMPSAYPLPAAGAPRYRRSLGWAHAVRAVQIPPQRHSGRVRDGSLSNITVDPIVDPTDGFIYHDERVNPGFDALRFTAARTRIGYGGYFIANPNLMSPPGSDFTILPLGNVMDIACTLVHQVGQKYINADVRLNANGTIYENDARAIEADMNGTLATNMTNVAMISRGVCVVDRTTNIQSTKKLISTVTITARGYILEEDVTIGFSNPNAAS